MSGENNPWKELATSGEIRIDPTTAGKLAQACGDLLGMVLAIKKEGGTLPAFTGFGPKPSGINLAKAFNDRGTLALTRLDEHIKVLGDMQRAFIDVGKAYKGAEAASIAELDAIVTDQGSLQTLAQQALEYNLETQYYRIEDFGVQYTLDRGYFAKKFPPKDKPLEGLRQPDQLAGTVAFDKEAAAGVGVDYGVMFSAQDLHTSWKVSHDNLGILDAADTWYWMGTTLNTKLENLRQALNGSKKTWEGDGAEQARKSSDAYVASTNNLSYELVSASDGLVYIVQWRRLLGSQLTDAGCAEEPENWGTDASETLERGRSVIDRIYAPAVVESSGAIPMLTVPVNPVAPVKVDEPGPDPGPGGGGGSGRGLGGGMPSLAGLSLPDKGSSAPDTSTAGSTGGSTSGLSDLASAATDALKSATEQPTSTVPTSTPNSDLGRTTPASATPARGQGGSGGSGGGATPLKQLNKPTTFPRADLTGTGAAVARAGLASMAGTPGTPGAAGAPARGGAAGADEKSRKSPAYLDSDEHLDEAIGGAQVVSRPVVDQ